MKKTLLIPSFLWIIFTPLFSFGEERTLRVYESETELTHAINEFADLVSKKEFDPAFRHLQLTDPNIQQEFNPVFEAISKETEGSGVFSTSSANFGDRMKKIGIMIAYENGYLFLDLAAFHKENGWEILNINLKANSNLGDILPSLPQYYFSFRE